MGDGVATHPPDSITPRFLLTDARHWEGGRVIRVWSYRWPVEIFHECCKQAAGLQASQVRKAETGRRHFRLSCVAQWLLQGTPAGGRKSERFAFAEDAQPTLGQKLSALTRDALGQLLHVVQWLFAQGHSQEQVLEQLTPT